MATEFSPIFREICGSAEGLFIALSSYLSFFLSILTKEGVMINQLGV